MAEVATLLRGTLAEAVAGDERPTRTAEAVVAAAGARQATWRAASE